MFVRPGPSFRRTTLMLVLGTGAFLPPRAAEAQRILGGGSDAVTLPRGAVRVGIGGESTVQRDRWRDGTLEGLGGSITTDAFGPLQFSLLAPIEQLVRDLGVAGFGASLGSTRLDARQRAFVTPLAIEYGVADWLTLSARATLVRTKAESQFRIRTDSGRATLGLNPIFDGSGVAAQNAATIGTYGTAAQALAARLAACQGDAGAFPECPTLLAEAGAVTGLSTTTSTFSLRLAQLYGTGVLRGARYIPFAGSPAEAALQARADSIRTALERYGVTSVTSTTGLPLGAQVPLAAADLDRLVRDSTDGFGARALNDASLTQIGDVHLGALIRVHDTFLARGASRFAPGVRGWRQAIAVEARIGTSYRERPESFLDQGTGSGTSAVSVRSITDLVPHDRLWATVAVGYTKAFAKDFRMRVPSSTDNEWLEWQREMVVPVTPGGQLDVELSPRWQLNDYIALGGQWRWRHKAADRHDVRVPTIAIFGTDVLADGAALDARSEAEEQRVGLSATYSTLAARARGIAGMHFEITYLHQQSVASGAGVVPKLWEDRLMIRYYTRFRAR